MIERSLVGMKWQGHDGQIWTVVERFVATSSGNPPEWKLKNDKTGEMGTWNEEGILSQQGGGDLLGLVVDYGDGDILGVVARVTEETWLRYHGKTGRALSGTESWILVRKDGTYGWDRDSSVRGQLLSPVGVATAAAAVTFVTAATAPDPAHVVPHSYCDEPNRQHVEMIKAAMGHPVGRR